MNHAARRPDGRGGVTLMECLVALGIMATIATVGLRTVFLADRAMTREVAVTEGTAAILALSAQLRDDTQVATAIDSPSPAEVRLETPGGVVSYTSEPGGVARRMGQETCVFEGVQADFTDTTPDLLKATLTDAAGGSVDMAVARRHAPMTWYEGEEE